MVDGSNRSSTNRRQTRDRGFHNRVVSDLPGQKKTSIEIPSVRKKIKKINAATLVGDYTHFHEQREGTPTLRPRQRAAGVLVYPKEANTNPAALPEVLTPATVLDALDRAQTK